ncbi:MAG: hypothetical protein JO013_07930 [Alphaproteobacteria bacterium]|nr:hypothetical protein [Alphaproteobacteria bacterium]
MGDAGTALLRALRAMLEGAGALVVEEVRSRRWASVTFAGARHELALRLEGDGAEAAAARFVAGLDAAEFALAGHIVADIALVAEERRRGCARLRIEALTVEDD